MLPYHTIVKCYHTIQSYATHEVRYAGGNYMNNNKPFLANKTRPDGLISNLNSFFWFHENDTTLATK